MRILGVGFLGYIGGHMTDVLTSAGHDVVVYDSMLYESRFMKEVPFVYGDIRDREKLSKLLPEFDVVVWLAGLVGDGACQVNEKLTRELNTNTVLWLADNFKGKIIFPSTCSVYGKNDALLDETSVTNPLSTYASTKLEAEQYLLKNRPDSLIFRLGTLFGMGDEHSRIRLDLVANVLAMRASRGETLRVFSGSQWRPLLHTRDVSEAVRFSLENGITGLYNLTYQNYILKDMAEEIVGLIPGSSVEYSELPFEDQRNYRVSGDKFASLGWKPKYTLEDGVRQVQKIIVEGRIKDTTDPIYSNAAYIKQLGDF